MISIQTQRQSFPLTITQSKSLELSRLLAAAVINHQFCHMLLDDPEAALQRGYQGEAFLFSDEERALIISIRADSLTDLAYQLIRTLDEQPYSYPSSSISL
jgi:hypothetical protein